MNSLNKVLNSFKILAVTFSLLLCFFTSPAIAAQEHCRPPKGPIHVQNASFDYSNTGNINHDFTVRSAIVSLPEGETGTIDEIIITGPDGNREFGCSNIKVKNGTNLIPACGGPAVLKAGTTTYQAKGSYFEPQDTFGNFLINLCDEFVSQNNK